MKDLADSLKEKMESQGLTLRALYLKLQERKSTITLTKLSKILRKIQNPSNQQEFSDLIDALGITDSNVIKELETQAMDFIPPRKLTEEELLESLPAFPPVFKSEAEAKEWQAKWFKLMQEEREPEP